MKILSIAIPAYNVSKYIEKCLSSLEVPAVMDKLEILVINDGSRDNTVELAAKFQKKYPDSCHIYSKENGGHGSGINFGIEHATGKYFKILDGDDWLNTDELEAFVRVLENQDADIVASDYLCIQDETEKVLQKKFCTDIAQQYGTSVFIDSGNVESVIKMHAFTIKTDILKRVNRKIDEHCFYVDSEYITYPIPMVKTVYFYHKFIYMYRLGRNGQSMDIKSMQKNRDQHLRVLNSMLDFYEQTPDLSLAVKKYIEKCIAQVLESHFQIYISLGLQKGSRKKLREIDLDIQNRFPGVYNSTSKKSICWLRKTDYLILPIGAIAYRIVK